MKTFRNKLNSLFEPRDLRDVASNLDETIRILRAEDARFAAIEAARAPARRANRDIER